MEDLGTPQQWTVSMPLIHMEHWMAVCMHAHKKASNYPPLKEESYALGLSVKLLFPIKTGF